MTRAIHPAVLVVEHKENRGFQKASLHNLWQLYINKIHSDRTYRNVRRVDVLLGKLTFPCNLRVVKCYSKWGEAKQAGSVSNSVIKEAEERYSSSAIIGWINIQLVKTYNELTKLWSLHGLVNQFNHLDIAADCHWRQYSAGLFTTHILKGCEHNTKQLQVLCTMNDVLRAHRPWMYVRTSSVGSGHLTLKSDERIW